MISSSQESILIVEDEPDIAAVLKLHLEDVGYATAWAGDGEIALTMLSDDSYALALVDIRMPRMGGFELLQRISEGGCCDTSLIMMTAHGSEDLAVQCMKMGAVDYFTKPFDLDDMLQRVDRALLNRRTLLEKRRLEQEKDDFFYMLSHDLKNPIAAVIGSIDITREGRLGPVNREQEEYLQSAIDSCNDVVTMIDNLLDLQRFEVGRMPLRLRRQQIAETAEYAVSRLKRSAEHEGISLICVTENELPDVVIDTAVMKRVFSNLISNAIKFTPEGGSITLSCGAITAGVLSELQLPGSVGLPSILSKSHGVIRCSVRDTGDGIPADEIGRIFERYTQSRATRDREQGGAGLGLAFCRMAIESFGGIIWAESIEGAGSEFIILLPTPAAEITEETP